MFSGCRRGRYLSNLDVPDTPEAVGGQVKDAVLIDEGDDVGVVGRLQAVDRRRDLRQAGMSAYPTASPGPSLALFQEHT